MYKYRNALFITVSSHDVVYAGTARDTCVPWVAQRDSEKYGRRRCEGVRRVTRTSRKYARTGTTWYRTWKGREDIRVSHPQQTTTRRIGNKVKDIKSSATIRQSLFRGPPLFHVSFV